MVRFLHYIIFTIYCIYFFKKHVLFLPVPPAIIMVFITRMAFEIIPKKTGKKNKTSCRNDDV